MHNKITLTSCLDSELLASAQNSNLQKQTFGLPNYVNNQEFKTFIEKRRPWINPNTGYMFIALDKEVYFPGDKVKGSVFFELFHLSFQNRLIISFEGVEILPRKLQRQVVDEEMMNGLNNQQNSSLGPYRHLNNPSQNKTINDQRNIGKIKWGYEDQDIQASSIDLINQELINKKKGKGKNVQEQEQFQLGKLEQFKSNDLDNSFDDGEGETVCLFRSQQQMFQFRGKHVPVGQYEFPFTFTLPDKIPSSFQYVNKQGENYQIKYVIHVYFEDAEPLLQNQVEIKVLQKESDRVQTDNGDLNIDTEQSNILEQLAYHKDSKKVSLKSKDKSNLKNSKKGDDDNMMFPLSTKKQNSLKKKGSKQEELKSEEDYIVDENVPIQFIYIQDPCCIVCSPMSNYQIEVCLMKNRFIPTETIETWVNLGRAFRNIEGLSMQLILQIDIYNFTNEKKMTTIHQQIFQIKKVKPFSSKEILQMDLRVVLETMAKIKEEHRALLFGDGYECLVKPANGIKTKDLKFVKPIGDGQALIRKGGLRDPLYNNFNQVYVDLSTTDGHTIRSKFAIQIEIQNKVMFGTKQYQATFPIKILQPDDVKTNSHTRSERNLLRIRKEFPKTFDPFLMPGSHYFI